MAFTARLGREATHNTPPNDGRLTDIRTKLNFSLVKSPLAVPRQPAQVSLVSAYHKQRQSPEVLLSLDSPHRHRSPLKPLARGMVHQAALQRSTVAVSPVRVRLASSNTPQPAPQAPITAAVDPCAKSEVLSALKRKRKRWASAVQGLPATEPTVQRELATLQRKPLPQFKRQKLNSEAPTKSDDDVVEPLSKRRRKFLPSSAQAATFKPQAALASPLQSSQPTATKPVARKTILVPDIELSDDETEEEKEQDEDKDEEGARELLKAVFALPQPGKNSSRRKIPIFCATGTKPYLPDLQAPTGGSVDLRRDREAALARLSHFLAQDSSEEEAGVGEGITGVPAPSPAATASSRAKTVSFAVPLTVCSLVTTTSKPAPPTSTPSIHTATAPTASQQTTATLSGLQQTAAALPRNSQPTAALSHSGLTQSTLSGLQQSSASLSGLPQPAAVMPGLSQPISTLPASSQPPATLSGPSQTTASRSEPSLQPNLLGISKPPTFQFGLQANVAHSGLPLPPTAQPGLPQPSVTVSGLPKPPASLTVISQPPSTLPGVSELAAVPTALQAPPATTLLSAQNNTAKPQSNAMTQSSFSFKLSTPAISLPNLAALNPPPPSMFNFTAGAGAAASAPTAQLSLNQAPSFNFGSQQPPGTPQTGFQFSAGAGSVSFAAGQSGGPPTSRQPGVRRGSRRKK